MNDHRLPRHDRPPEPWLPHPGTTEPPPAPPPCDVAFPDPAPAPRPAGLPTTLPLIAPPPGASAFVRFVYGVAAGRKSIPVAVALALLGPLGLFYVSFLHGVAALVIVPLAVRPLAGAGAGAAMLLCWCITVPWSIIAARRHNARRGFKPKT